MSFHTAHRISWLLFFLAIGILGIRKGRELGRPCRPAVPSWCQAPAESPPVLALPASLSMAPTPPTLDTQEQPAHPLESAVTGVSVYQTMTGGVSVIPL